MMVNENFLGGGGCKKKTIRGASMDIIYLEVHNTLVEALKERRSHKSIDIYLMCICFIASQTAVTRGKSAQVLSISSLESSTLSTT